MDARERLFGRPVHGQDEVINLFLISKLRKYLSHFLNPLRHDDFNGLVAEIAIHFGQGGNRIAGSCCQRFLQTSGQGLIIVPGSC